MACFKLSVASTSTSHLYWAVVSRNVAVVSTEVPCGVCREPDCVQHAALPVKVQGRHCHTDGGLIVWRPGTLRATACSGLIVPEAALLDGSGRRIVPPRAAKRDKSVDASNDVVGSRFAAYCASALFDVVEVPRGVDEILFDAYLSSLPGLDLKRDPRVLMRQHVHKMAQQPRFYVDGDLASSSDSESDSSDTSSVTSSSSSSSSSSTDDDHANCKAVLSSYKNALKLGDAFPRSMLVDCGSGGSEVFYVCAELASKKKPQKPGTSISASSRRFGKAKSPAATSSRTFSRLKGHFPVKVKVNGRVVEALKSPKGSSPVPSPPLEKKRGRPRKAGATTNSASYDSPVSQGRCHGSGVTRQRVSLSKRPRKQQK
jgi:hypothetical protein